MYYWGDNEDDEVTTYHDDTCRCDDYDMSHICDACNEKFADPGGKSALRTGVRCFPCPTCGDEDVLTSKDVSLGYQCDDCADGLEGAY